MSKRSADEAGINGEASANKKGGSSAHLVDSLMKEFEKAPDEVKKQIKPRVERLVVYVGGRPEDGGKRFVTSRETLTKLPGSHLAALFTKGGPNEAKREIVPNSDPQSVPKEEEAYIISDRSGDHFMFILNFLRDNEIDSPDDLTIRKSIEDEAEYYGLTQLVTLLNAAPAGANVHTSADPVKVITDPIEFDGKTDNGAVETEVQLPDNKSFSVTLCLSLQRKPTKTQGKVPIFHKGNTKDQVMGSLFLTEKKQLLVCLSNESGSVAGSDLTSKTALDLKTKYHIAIVFNTSTDTCQLFLNGKEDASATCKGITPGKGLLKVGVSDSFGKTRMGAACTIWAMSVHSDALSAGLIEKDMSANRDRAL
mmetsp:Transcript_39798/g.71297  ORF Transcript_39798/g.71297 Transcript_39798/m.71297 type:complete len:366 (-) Transcript_39798:208-1305(-)